LIEKELVIGGDLADALWKIYDQSFEKLNRLSPCRQSYHKKDFFEIMKKPNVFKYVIRHKGNEVGLAMISNDLKNSSWISEDFFVQNFRDIYSSGRLFYFLGIALLPEYRRKSYALTTLMKIKKDLPSESFIGFDHSKRFNKHISFFPYMLGSPYRVKKRYLDSMRYYVVELKND
jgi:hypothetical protein